MVRKHLKDYSIITMKPIAIVIKWCGRLVHNHFIHSRFYRILASHQLQSLTHSLLLKQSTVIATRGQSFSVSGASRISQQNMSSVPWLARLDLLLWILYGNSISSSSNFYKRAFVCF
jgi:hypothetical protein